MFSPSEEYFIQAMHELCLHRAFLWRGAAMEAT